MHITPVLFIIFISRAGSKSIPDDELTQNEATKLDQIKNIALTISDAVKDAIKDTLDEKDKVIETILEAVKESDTPSDESSSPLDVIKDLAESIIKVPVDAAKGTAKGLNNAVGSVNDALAKNVRRVFRFNEDVANKVTGFMTTGFYSVICGVFTCSHDAKGRSAQNDVVVILHPYGYGLGKIDLASGEAWDLDSDLIDEICQRYECAYAHHGRSEEESPLYKLEVKDKDTKEVVARFESKNEIKI